MISLVSFISAVPSWVDGSSIDEGLIINIPELASAKINESLYFEFNTYNKTSGLIVSGTSCLTYLYDINGTTLLENFPTTIDGLHHQLTIDGGNLTRGGVYSLAIYCNSSEAGGYVVGYFELTKTGLKFNEDESITHGFLILLLISVSIFFLLFAKSTENAGIKLFFNMISYLMMFVSVGAGYIMLQSVQSNMLPITKVVLFTIGIVLIVIMFYIFINLTKQSLALMRAKKGFGSEFDDSSF
jgi:hypothetical protein